MQQDTGKVQDKTTKTPTTSNNETTVLYEPLDDLQTEIRVVTVSPGDFEDDIYCYLSKVSMKNRPSYEALSYTWGDLNHKRQMYLNSTPFDITENLESALRHLRDPTQSRVLWIDALCINQRDNLERNSQVVRMNKIYKRATKVIAWLGEEYQNSSLAFDAFEVFPIDNKTHWDTKGDPRLKTVLLDPIYSIAIYKLFDRPWFSRIWTVQESVLPRTLHFVCGHRQISMDVLSATQKSLHAHVSHCCHHMWTKTEHLKRIDETMRKIALLHSMRQYFVFSDFVDVLSITMSRSCSDPRDKIYGLLGISSNTALDSIAPDYSSPVSTVFEKTAFKLIEIYRDLKIFSHRLPKSIRIDGTAAVGLPSWVPHWNAEISRKSLFIILSARVYFYHEYYRASTGSLASIKLVRPGKIMLRGMLLGRLSVLGTAQDHESGYNHDTFKLWQDLTGVTKQPGRSYSNCPATTYYDAYWQTLCGSFVLSREDMSRGKMSEPERTSNHSRHRHQYEAWRNWNEKYDGNLELLPSVSKEATGAEISHFQHCVNVFTYCRRMFVTKRWLGLAPMDAKVGDRIALLAGGKVPYILRPKDGSENEYEMIGDAYVHGIMDGQSWDPDNLVDITLV